MNPLHLDYIKHSPHNNYRQLFSIIDGLDPKKRDEAMLYTLMQFVMMERTPDAGPHDKIGDTLTDYTNYNRFKSECGRLPATLSQAFVVNAVVYFTLSYCYGRAEMDKNAVVEAHEGIIERAQAALEEATEQATRTLALTFWKRHGRRSTTSTRRFGRRKSYTPTSARTWFGP